MKIVIDGRAIKHSGIGRIIEESLAGILELDKTSQYSLLVRDIDRPNISLKADNLTLISANYDWYTFAEQIKGYLTLRRLKPDLVHFPNFNHPVCYRGKFVMTVHDLTLWNFKNINHQKAWPQAYVLKQMVMKFVMSRGVRKAEYVISDSDFVREELVKKFNLPKTKVKRIYGAAEAAYKKPRVDLEKLKITKPFVLYVGNAYPHKNLENLILAFGKLTTTYMLDYQLVIAGRMDDFHQQLAQEVKDSGIEDRIIFTDYVTNSELAGLYKAATIYSFPSLSEGFGLPGLEAMSYGLPVASSDETCLPEVYEDAAVYYDAHDPENMAKVMAELITDKDKQEMLRERGYVQVKKYSWQECAKELLVVYKSANRK